MAQLESNGVFCAVGIGAKSQAGPKSIDLGHPKEVGQVMLVSHFIPRP